MDRDVSAKSIVIFVASLVYLISPIDLIRDSIIGLGQIDDAAILGLNLLTRVEWRIHGVNLLL